MTTRLAPICFGCTRLKAIQRGTEGKMLCDAFPEGIPAPIVLNDADHRRPFAGDGGKMFEAKTLADEEYATLLFDMTDEDFKAIG